MREATWADDPGAPHAGPAAVDGPRFELLGLIGEGGMGRVSEALDHRFRRIVAVKQVRRESRAAEAVRAGGARDRAARPPRRARGV